MNAGGSQVCLLDMAAGARAHAQNRVGTMDRAATGGRHAALTYPPRGSRFIGH